MGNSQNTIGGCEAQNISLDGFIFHRRVCRSMAIINELGLGAKVCFRARSETAFELFVVCLRNLICGCFLDAWVVGQAATLLSKPSGLLKSKGAVEVGPHPGPCLGLSSLRTMWRRTSKQLLALQLWLCLYFLCVSPQAPPPIGWIGLGAWPGVPAFGGLRVTLTLTTPPPRSPSPLPSPAPGHGNCSPTPHLFKVEKYSPSLKFSYAHTHN